MTEEACWSARESMDEQREAQELASKPFKTAEPGRPDLIVEPQKGDDIDSSTFACAVAAKPREEGQELIDNVSTRSVEVPPSTKANARHPASISNIGAPIAQGSQKKAAPVKKPMTPRRFVTFLCGLFLAGVAGSLSNGLITSITETVFAPQYVKDFHKAQALPDREQAFYGMHLALTEGQKMEPLSRRFTKLTVSLAEQLDDDARYLEAKTEWEKAALPSEVAPPEFRECKRSYLIDEAQSEHLAFLSKMSKGVDENLLKEVEVAADIFQKSGVTHHGPRAVNAFIAAGELAADNNDFERARDNFNRAQMITIAQWQQGGSAHPNLLEARWQATLQQTIAKLLSSKRNSPSHIQYVASNLTVENRLALENDLEAKNWDKLDSIFDTAEKKHLQSFDGDTLVSDMYSTLATPSQAFGHNRNRLSLLQDWAHARPHSVRPSLAIAYFYNARAEAFAFTVQHENSSSRMRYGGLRRAHSALAYLQTALGQNSKVAFEPSFIKAVQTNMSVGGRLTSWPDTQTKLISDLQSASITMVGDDAQFNLDQISNDVFAESQAPDSMELLLKRATDLANRIGADAGDEFYARAVSRTGVAPTSKFLDKARLMKGASLLAKKYGTAKSSLP